MVDLQNPLKIKLFLPHIFMTKCDEKYLCFTIIILFTPLFSDVIIVTYWQDRGLFSNLIIEGALFSK